MLAGCFKRLTKSVEMHADLKAIVLGFHWIREFALVRSILVLFPVSMLIQHVVPAVRLNIKGTLHKRRDVLDIISHSKIG